MWVFYQEPAGPDDPRGLTLDTSGLDVTITDGSGNPVKDPDENDVEINNIVPTSGPDGDAIQFFVPTDSDVLTVTVDGLIPHETVMFTFGNDGVTSDPVIDDPGTPPR